MRILSVKKLFAINYFYLLLVFMLLIFVLLMIMSCTSGVNIGEANKVLTSFTIEWPEGFEGKCGSKYPLTVTIKALAQDESIYKWSDVVDIIPTNTNVEVVPSQVKLTDGQQTVELVLRHSSEEPVTTDLRISGGGVITTLPESVTVYPNVTGISFSETVFLVKKDSNLQITALIEPADAWDETLIWSSEDENIATVDENGVVTGINYGTTKIKAKTSDGGYEATCDVEVTFVTWHTMLGGSNADWGKSIQQTNDGGYIIAGNSDSKDITGLLQNNHGSDDYYILKLNSDGNIIWHTMLGGSGYDGASSIQQTTDGGYIIAGYSYSTDITGLLDNNHGGCDYYIVKLNPDGSVAWHAMFGGSGDDYGCSVQQISNGGYIIAGNSYSTDITGLLEDHHGSNNYDCYVVKLKPDGSIDWHTMLGGIGDDCNYSIQQTSDGGYIVAGYSYSTDITGLLQDNHGGTDYYVVKLNSDGSISWQTMLGGSGNDEGNSIQQTLDGGYIVAGYSNTTNISGLLQGNHGINDYYVVKLNSDGSIDWQTMLGGSSDDWGYSIQQTLDGGYIIAGSSCSSDISELIQNSQRGDDYYIVKLNPDGGINWQTMLGGNDDDECYSIQQTSDGGYIVVGASESTNMTGLLNDEHDFDIYIAKLW